AGGSYRYTFVIQVWHVSYLQKHHRPVMYPITDRQWLMSPHFLEETDHNSRHRLLPVPQAGPASLIPFVQIAVADQQGHTLDVNLNVYTETSLERRIEAVQQLESAMIN